MLDCSLFSVYNLISEKQEHLIAEQVDEGILSTCSRIHRTKVDNRVTI